MSVTSVVGRSAQSTSAVARLVSTVVVEVVPLVVPVVVVELVVVAVAAQPTSSTAEVIREVMVRANLLNVGSLVRVRRVG